MIPPKVSGYLLAALAITLTAGISGCGDSESKTESQSFTLSGKTLKIDAAETSVLVKNGSGQSVEVERVLKGKAADDGNAVWSMEGDTLQLRISCSGVVLSCEGLHTVTVPKGVQVQLTASGSAVELNSVTGDVDATVTNDGSLRISDPAGKLKLVSHGGAITVTKARSAEVTARTSNDGNIRLEFARPPLQVEASASGSVQVTVPKDEQTYRIVGADAGSLSSDGDSDRSITVAAADGTARVQRAE